MLDNFLTEPQCEDFEEEESYIFSKYGCPFSDCDWKPNEKVLKTPDTEDTSHDYD